MTPLRLLAVSASVAVLASCGNSGGDSHYDTTNPYGAPQGGGGQTAQAPAQAANPTYDTPAAYEESTGTAPAAAPESAIVDPGMTAPRSTQHTSPKPTGASPKPAAASAGGTSHLVVKGDTLGGIARKYGVSQDAIKKANNMTKDTVVLGKTLQIPAR
ncbi:LysM peptidoglycan-binding domain-containing protein [Luteolibacter ambystomatis]|uniref:LysM peptidoglycan-binding domain-containing protein n=1 Tax=Luteolibacter ambystomatis TaxID=2824561 RepID=A0A975G6X3_9BACT|nr:LysM peptidoglycan-binding domain-containing protein [Luteolibacter ambystomatis]QUE49886.1 LysM peptidoglycan-binding domain-containing protein [Luteolibacter ambystomatis]